MNDAVSTPSPAGNAGDENLSEEQIWNEIEAEENKTAEDDTAAASAADDDQTPDTPDSEGEEGAQDASDDAPDGDDDDTGTDQDPDNSDDADDASDAEDTSKDNVDWKQRALSAEGRATGQQRRADRLQNELNKINGRKAARDPDARKARAEKLDEVSEEYGDVINPVKEVVEDQNARLDALDKADDERAEDIQQELADIEKGEYDVFIGKNPDGFKVINENTDLFAEWIEDQPKKLRDAFEVNKERMVDGASAALVVSEFAAAIAAAEQDEPSPEDETNSEQTKLENRRKRQLEGAKSAKGGQASAAAGDMPPGDDASEEDIWNYWDRQDAKKRR